RRVRDVDPDLEHGRRDEDVDLARLEPAHDRVLRLEAEPPVHEPDGEVGEDVLGEMSRHVRRRLEVQRLRLLDERVDDVDLAAAADLVAQELVDLAALRFGARDGDDGAPARRAARSRSLSDEVSSVTGTPSGSRSWRKVMKCCSARISVGTITAAW